MKTSKSIECNSSRPVIARNSLDLSLRGVPNTFGTTKQSQPAPWWIPRFPGHCEDPEHSEGDEAISTRILVMLFNFNKFAPAKLI